MNCTTCRETKLVPTCTENLIIGTVEADTDYTVYFKNNATNYCSKQDVTSDVDGNLWVDLTKPYPDFYSENFYYSVWVTLEDAGIEDYETVNVGSEEIQCFTVRFKNIYELDVSTEFTNYPLELCS